jgi:DNA invertase Pin-like site-specific DNA recombinase
MKVITYLRVSTKNQGKSGLGLEAQRERINCFLETYDGELLAEYVDIESGSKNERKELQKAITHAKKIKGTLVIAKLDRISRRVSFIANLMESGIDFKVADMGNANSFQLHIYAALAQEERRLISERTKSALQAAKARGVKLGENGKVLAKHNKQVATRFANSIKEHLNALRSQGLSFRAIAIELNKQNIQSYAGKEWYGSSVRRAYNRL